MSIAGVAGMMFQSVFEGSLSMKDTEIERRPYHKNCTCALHSKGGVCSNACQRNISFHKKQSWNYGSLCMKASTTSKISPPPPLVGNVSTCTSTSTGNRESLNVAQIRLCHIDNRWTPFRG